MAKAHSLPIIAAHLSSGQDFVVGEQRVTGIAIGPGNPLPMIVIVTLEPCEDDEGPCERRFNLAPSSLVLELGAPVEVEIADEKPDIVRPEGPRLVVPGR